MSIHVEHSELKITHGLQELTRICDHYWPFSDAINQLRDKVYRFQANFEGKTIDEYRAWKRAHTRDDAFPDGESLNDAARRYARGFRSLLAGDWRYALVVCHEIPIRYALNAVAGSTDFDAPVHDIPNAAPFLFDEHSLGRAAERIGELAKG